MEWSSIPLMSPPACSMHASIRVFDAENGSPMHACRCSPGNMPGRAAATAVAAVMVMAALLAAPAAAGPACPPVGECSLLQQEGCISCMLLQWLQPSFHTGAACCYLAQPHSFVSDPCTSPCQPAAAACTPHADTSGRTAFQGLFVPLYVNPPRKDLSQLPNHPMRLLVGGGCMVGAALSLTWPWALAAPLPPASVTRPVLPGHAHLSYNLSPHKP